MSQTEQKRPDNLPPINEADYYAGGKTPPGVNDFPEDKRKGAVIAASHKFLGFVARNARFGLRVVKNQIEIDQKVAKNFAGRLENDGALSLGAKRDDYDAFVSMRWDAAKIYRGGRGGDKLALMTKPLDDFGSIVKFQMPLSVVFVDRFVDACAKTGRDLPSVLRMRRIAAEPGRIVADEKRFGFEIPLFLNGFEPLDHDEVVPIEPDAEEPAMTPLFGITVSTAEFMPSEFDLRQAFDACPVLVDTLSPVASRRSVTPLAAPDKEPKMDSSLVHTPRFQPNPLPTRR